MGAVALSGIHLHRRKLNAFSLNNTLAYDRQWQKGDWFTRALTGVDGRVTVLLVHWLVLTEGDWFTRALTGVDGVWLVCWQVHRAAGITAAVLTISSVILMVVYIGGYAEVSTCVCFGVKQTDRLTDLLTNNTDSQTGKWTCWPTIQIVRQANGPADQQNDRDWPTDKGKEEIWNKVDC